MKRAEVSLISRRVAAGVTFASVLFASLLIPGTSFASFPGGPGLLAFATDRTGNYEIYSMDLATGTQINLTNNTGHDLLPTWSAAGDKIAFVSTRSGSSEIYTMNSDGSNVVRVTNNFFLDTAPTWSPDGSKVAFTSYRDGNFDVYVANLDGTNQLRLTSGTSSHMSPSWSPDGTRIAFVGNTTGSPEIFVMNADGTNVAQLTSVGGAGGPDWSSDGSKMAFDHAGDVYSIQLDGAGLTNWTASSSTEILPTWSPDGTKMTYASNAGGSWDVYVLPLDGSGATSVTSPSSATEFHQDWQPIASAADGSVFMKLGGPPASRSGMKRFIVEVMNSGPDPMTETQVSVAITVNGAPASGTVSRLRPANDPTLNAGESAQFQFEWRYPKGSFAKGDEVTFSASLTSAQYDPDSSNNSTGQTVTSN